MNESYRNFFICNGETRPTSAFDNAAFLGKGFSIYEVVRLIRGVPLFWEDHVQRLSNSARLTGIELWLWLSPARLHQSLERLQSLNQTDFGNVKLLFNQTGDKNYFSCYFLKHHYPTSEQYRHGIKTILHKAERRNPNAKTSNLALRSQSDTLKEKHNAYEVLLEDREGFVNEGSRSNVFVVSGENVFTPPLASVLPGITRSKVLEVCRKAGIRLLEKKLHRKDLAQAEALFISGTSPGVLPVARLNSWVFEPDHPIVRQIMLGYKQMVQDYLQKYPLVNYEL